MTSDDQKKVKQIAGITRDFERRIAELRAQRDALIKQVLQQQDTAKLSQVRRDIQE